MTLSLELRATAYRATHGMIARLAIVCVVVAATSAILSSKSFADDINGSTTASALRYHTVERGEYLSEIAKTFGVSVQELVTANHLASSNHIKAGERLVIPALNSSPTPSAPAPVPAAPAVRIERRLTLTFSSLDVRVVLDQISSYAHVDVLMTPGAKGIVSVNIRNRSADDAIRLVTAVAGLSMVKVGNAYVVGPAEEVAKAAGEFGQVEIVALHWITPAEAVAGLARLAPHVSVQPAKNGIIISGLTEDVAQAHTAMASLDVEPAPAPAPHSESRIVTLEHAAPASAERIINQAYPDVKVSLQDRTLILTGSPIDLESALKSVQGIDILSPVVAEASEVVVYRLKYLNAQRSEEAVKKAFPTLTVTVAPEANAPPAAVFNPLNTIFGTGTGDFATTSTTSTTSPTTTTTPSAAGGVTPQPLSRPTRIVLIGPKSVVAAARDMLEQVDVPQPSVRIEAVMLEIDRTDTQNLGITWDFTNTGLTFTEPAGSNVTFGTLQRSSASFATSLQALFTQNKAKILASPNISVVDNEDASIFIGDMIRFLGGTSTSLGTTIQNVEALPVGIALLMRPRIHPDGSVTLKVHPVISTVTATVDGLPQTSSREADTTVRLMQGEQMVIGGLDRTDVTSVLNKVPILGDIPLIKEFFTSRTHTTDKTEVIILLRAYATTTEQAPAHDFRKGDPK